jgi:hypothetical protein
MGLPFALSGLVCTQCSITNELENQVAMNGFSISETNHYAFMLILPDEVPNIGGFLNDKKKVCDNDPETNPFDDVRHYAYEGDGNTTGSLSSLASGELCF